MLISKSDNHLTNLILKRPRLGSRKHILIHNGKSHDKFQMTESPLEAAKNADVVLTDVWASMGQESEQKIREAAFAGFQVNDELMAVTNEGCMVQHCLPAHRGEEITAEVFEAHADEIFDEAENRMHAQKADTEILARKTSRDDIYIFRENFFPRSMLFHQVYDTLCIINVFIISESIHILKPSGLCLFQYIIRKDRSKTILL